jgi:hypothetical protein
VSKRLFGLVLAILGSLIIGAVAGNRFYDLYVSSIPEALKASTSMAGTRLVFLGNGIGLGLIVAVWTMLAVGLARFFRTGEKPGLSADDTSF